tara:strand:- start:613 stop:2922 length:2310 start_codon:yes stop_codon:yes gene_type:complete
MDKCRYKTLLRNSAKLISNSQYTNQNTAYIPLDVYTCYDNFTPPIFTVSGATKPSSFNTYNLSGSPYTLLNMLPTGPTGSTTNSVWNTSQSATTIEYYLPDSFASGYTGKFRSSVYKWDDNENGFVYPPVHQKTFSNFSKTADLKCSASTTSTTFSVFFSISGISSSTNYLSAPSFYWWGKDIRRTQDNLSPIWDGFFTAGTLTNYLSGVMINTGGTFSSQLALPSASAGGSTATTYNSHQSDKNMFTVPVKNGHILPIPNPTTGAINVTNDGVTGNGGYWYKNQCYMSGMSFDMQIGQGMSALTGGPTFVSATSAFHGYYTGFATGNVYLYSACCQHKISDTIPVSSLLSSKSPSSARNSNDYLVKGSFVYSGDGTTASCYLTSGNTYDTLIDNPNSSGYDSLTSNHFKYNLYYSGTDHTFITVSNPPKPLILYAEAPQVVDISNISTSTSDSLSEDLDIDNTTIELVVESLPVTSSGQTEYYLSQDPIGDVCISVNGITLVKDIEYIKDQRRLTIIVDKTIANTVNIKTTDEVVATYVKGTSTKGFISETNTVPSTGVLTGGTLEGITYNVFNYNTATTYTEGYATGFSEYYTTQPMDTSMDDITNIIVLLNGVRLTPTQDYWKSISNNYRIIFNPNITLIAGDIVNVYYLTNLLGQSSGSLSTPTKEIFWQVSPPPKTSNGRFEVEVTGSGDTSFLSASTYDAVNYQIGVGNYRSSIGPFTELYQKYLYRVKNTRTYVSQSGSSITTTATSMTNKFDTNNPAMESY